LRAWAEFELVLRLISATFRRSSSCTSMSARRPPAIMWRVMRSKCWMKVAMRILSPSASGRARRLSSCSQRRQACTISKDWRLQTDDGVEAGEGELVGAGEVGVHFLAPDGVLVELGFERVDGGRRGLRPARRGARHQPSTRMTDGLPRKTGRWPTWTGLSATLSKAGRTIWRASRGFGEFVERLVELQQVVRAGRATRGEQRMDTLRDEAATAGRQVHIIVQREMRDAWMGGGVSGDKRGLCPKPGEPATPTMGGAIAWPLRSARKRTAWSRALRASLFHWVPWSITS